MAQKRCARRASKRRKLSAATVIRCLGAGLLVLAFLFQNFVAERHFHPISAQAAAGGTQARGSTDVLRTPFVPTSDQHDDDCPLCQVLGLGATTDVPQGIVIVEPARTTARIYLPSDAKPLGTLRAGHQPRGPPVPFSVI